jgi:metal-sulfur cluster biosynthetic enzyme
LKKQTGISIDAQLWDSYRDLCNREKLRLSEPIAEYLRLVLQNGSVLAVLNMMRGMGKARPEGLEGFEAYARVLLNWYKNGQLWIRVTDETEAPVEPMLLHALKDVADPQLRRDIQKTLMIRPRKQKGKKEKRKKSAVKEKLAARQEPPAEPAAVATSEKIEDIRKKIAGHDMDAEQAQEMLEKIRRIREKLKGDKKGRNKNR